jgi:isoquinoline 1-oxidoreductase subunit alpha
MAAATHRSTKQVSRRGFLGWVIAAPTLVVGAPPAGAAILGVPEPADLYDLTDCGLEVCRACTSHINGKAFNPCAVPVGDIGPDDEITTIEGLPATVGQDLHPMQEAWLEVGVAQCGYCQPPQIMAAVAKVEQKGGALTDADFDEIRNICRCGTYHRIREAINLGAASM